MRVPRRLHEYWDLASRELHRTSLIVPSLSLSLSLSVILFVASIIHTCKHNEGIHIWIYIYVYIYICVFTYSHVREYTHVDTWACPVVIALLGYWTPNHEVTTVSSSVHRSPWLASIYPCLRLYQSKLFPLARFTRDGPPFCPKFRPILSFLRVQPESSSFVSLCLSQCGSLFASLLRLLYLFFFFPSFLVLFLRRAPLSQRRFPVKGNVGEETKGKACDSFIWRAPFPSVPSPVSFHCFNIRALDHFRSQRGK